MQSALSLETIEKFRILPGLHCWQPVDVLSLQTAHEPVHNAQAGLRTMDTQDVSQVQEGDD